MKILKILTLAACPCFLPSIAIAQRAGSAAAYSAMAGMHNASVRAEIDWDKSKKITYVNPLPTTPLSGSPDLERVTTGWTGDMSGLGWNVVSIMNKTEMLLTRGNDTTIWLTDYPTAEFVDDDRVYIVGPIKAGPTKKYNNAFGASITVRTFQLLKGQALQDWQEIQAEKAAQKELQEIRSDVESVANQFIWGENTPIRPDRIPKNQQRKYKTVVAKTLKRFEAGEIDPAARNHITADGKTGKVTYNSPEVKEQAIWHLKSLTNPPIKAR
jgi:hypothetical protein